MMDTLTTAPMAGSVLSLSMRSFTFLATSPSFGPDTSTVTTSLIVFVSIVMPPMRSPLLCLRCQDVHSVGSEPQHFFHTRPRCRHFAILEPYKFLGCFGERIRRSHQPVTEVAVT